MISTGKLISGIILMFSRSMSRLKDQFKVQMSKHIIFQEIKQFVTSVIPRMCVILTGEFNYNIILMISRSNGQIEGQNCEQMIF